MSDQSLINKRKNKDNAPAWMMHSINYDLHVQHLVAELAKLAGPELRVSLRRVELRVRSGKASRIEALSLEIARLEVIRSAEVMVATNP